jgi:putative PIN family toxin of toxin-antitoxin system
MTRAVLDSNILVSALIKPIGKPAQIIAHARADKFTLILSEDILAEARGVLHRKHIQKKYHPTPDAIRDFLDALRDLAEFVTDAPVANLIPNDPPDNLIIASAVGGQADYLVSGNAHLLDLKQHGKIQMVTPAQFLTMLENAE